MKSFCIALLLIFGLPLFAQNYTTTYELAYKRDSTNRGDVRRENFMLLLHPRGSRFMSEGKYVRDSALAKFKNVPMSEGNIAVGLGLMAKIPRTAFSAVIDKDQPAGRLTYYGQAGMAKLSYEEKPELLWKILPEKKQIGELACQKAEVDFGGRHFIAWYAESLPFSDGPYKFSGLPGLIVEISDDREDYHYSLLSFKKEDIPLMEQEKFVKTTKAKYAQAEQNFRANPEAALAGTGIEIVSSPATSGPSLRQRWSHQNNPIELKP